MENITIKLLDENWYFVHTFMENDRIDEDNKYAHQKVLLYLYVIEYLLSRKKYLLSIYIQLFD